MKALTLRRDKHACTNKIHLQNVLVDGAHTAFAIRCHKISKAKKPGLVEVLRKGQVIWSDKCIGLKPAMKFLAKAII